MLLLTIVCACMCVFLRCSDYKGWTCLHYAAVEGYTQTMSTLLTSNSKLLDKTDDEGVWSLSYLCSGLSHKAKGFCTVKA